MPPVFRPDGAQPAPPLAPPHSIEAEQSVLGAMLIEAGAIRKAAGILRVGDFYRPGHQALYDVITALDGRGEPADLITVQEELKTREKMDAIGGLPYLVSLFDTVPSAANVEHYANIVFQKALLRETAAAGREITQRALAEDADASALLRDADRRLARVTDRASQSGLPGVSVRRKTFAESVITFRDIPPPPSELPYLFGPYLNIGESHWLTGQTGIGKSTWLYNVLPALAEGAELWGLPCEPTRILYFDTESGELGRSLKAQRLRPNRAEAPALANLFVQAEPPRFPSDLPALLSFVHAEGISLVVFDTVRRCFSIKDENDNAEFYRQVVPVLDALKAQGVASLTMGHPAKNGGAGARGAGAQEDAPGIILTLTMHRGEIKDPNGVIELSVTKNRILGVGLPPLLLRRVGGDQFRVLSEEDAPRPPGAALPAQPAKKLAEWQNKIEDLLGRSPEALSVPVISVLLPGASESTVKRAVSALRKAGRIIHDQQSGYVLCGGPEAAGVQGQGSADPRGALNLNLEPPPDTAEAAPPPADTGGRLEELQRWLSEQPEPQWRGALIKKMLALGQGEAEANRAIADLQASGRIEDKGGGFVLAAHRERAGEGVKQ